MSYSNNREEAKLTKDPKFIEQLMRGNVTDRCLAAEFGNDYHLEELTADNDSSVLCKVAFFGNDYHRNLLLDDCDEKVLCMIAACGTNDHRRILRKKKDYFALQEEIERYNGEMRAASFKRRQEKGLS